MKIYFVTTNDGKFEEVKRMLPGHDVIRKDVAYPEIQADCLEEVAEFGMNFLVRIMDGNIMLEDSGLFIEALNGFPSVYSAYVFKSIGNRGILKLMEGAEKRRAYFKSVIAFYDSEIKFFEGKCHGHISEHQKGKEGFGYDPIFVPEGCKKTFGEMDKKEKNEYSHRGKAVAKLREFLER
jgi:XTP/dITP diphosphohydrolase